MSPIARSVSIFTCARSGSCCARSTNGAANRVLENCRRERIIGVVLCDAEAAEKDLANDQHSWILLWSAQACLRRKLACALTDSEQTPHEEKRQQAAALQSAQWTIVLVAAGLLRVHLCLSVVSFILLVAVLTRSTSARKLPAEEDCGS